jgi:glycosyltransferase involved in cell wall biosynthesis
LAGSEEKVRLVYHGLDLNRFPIPTTKNSSRDGRDAANPVQFLSVGRAVEKKGLDTLLEAFARLPDDLHWKWTHIAGGPLLNELKQQAESLGLSDKVEFLGSQAQSRVLQAYNESDLFVLPCRIAADGDRDGLPNVIVEAQSQKLAVISTPISGIPELIDDGVNGALVPPNNPEKLADALERLSSNPDLRNEMGKAGMKRVREDFDAAKEIDLLLKLLGQAP